MKTRNILFSAATVALLLGSAFAFGCDDKEDPGMLPNGNEEPGDKPGDNDKPGDEPDGPTTIDKSKYPPHYILIFYEIDGIKASVDDNLNIVVESSPGEIVEYTFKDPERADELERYEALCERYGDTSYDNEERIIHFPLFYNPVQFPMYNIADIDVVSAADYDTDHPAGTSLRDLCELISWSPREYIASGYTETYDWSVRPEFFPERYYSKYIDKGMLPVHIRLDEYTPEDLELIGRGMMDGWIFILHFDKAPDEGNALQKFTLTLTDERGRTYTAVSDVAEWR